MSWLCVSSSGLWPADVPKKAITIWKLTIPAIVKGGKAIVEEAIVDFTNVFVANAGMEKVADKINDKLSQGLHVVLEPGVYDLEKSIVIGGVNQVLLGLGLATLQPMGAFPAILVKGSAKAARIAAVTLQPGNFL